MRKCLFVRAREISLSEALLLLRKTCLTAHDFGLIEMWKMRTQRRPGTRTAIAAICEKYENRELLTQLVPIADLPDSYYQHVNETPETAILFAYLGRPEEISVSVFNKASGLLSPPQLLRGSTPLLASQDGSTLLTNLAIYEPGTGNYIAREFLFYRQSTSTGLFEETARYQFLNADNPYVSPALSIEADGMYVSVYDASNQYSLLFLPSTQAAAPITVFGTSSGFSYITSVGNTVFATGNSIGLQLLAPNGGSPQHIGESFDTPLGVAGGNVFVSRYAGSLRRLVSIEIATSAEESLLVQPSDSFFQLLSEEDGPDGKTLLSMSNASEFSVVSTDGTTAGTHVFPASEQIPGPNYQTTGTTIRGTSRILVSLSGTELWVWDLSDGSNHRVIDTNPFGTDRISSVTGSGGKAWFLAQIEDSRFGIFQTDGLQTTLEYHLPGGSGVQLIAGMDAAYLLDRNSAASAVPGYGLALYEIDQQAPDLDSGPTNLETAVVRQGDSAKLDIHWDAIDGVSFYEVVIVPWQESGKYGFEPNYLQVSTTTYATEYSVDLSGRGYYGWQTALVRGVTVQGQATMWSASTFALTEPLVLPTDGQFFFDHNSLRFGFRNYNGQNYRMLIRRSNDPASDILFDSQVFPRFENETANSPFSSSGYYYYLEMPTLENGDYAVEFYNKYTDSIPDTQDLSLARVSQLLPISIRNGSVIRNPEALNVAVRPGGVQFSWNGTLQPGEDGFQVWVNDIGRSVAKVIYQKVNGHSLLNDLPNGRYQGWVGLKDHATGITHWSPAKEFAVATKAPQILSPGPVSAIERPVFQWTGSKSSSYEVWLTNLATGQRIVLATVIRATQWTPPFNLAAGQYAFWVRELVTSAAASPWSTRFQLTQQEPAVKVTSGLSPALDQTPVLGWATKVGAVSYELWISRTGVPGAVYRRTGLTGTSHRVATPLGNGQFTVWVQANLGGGKTTAWGPGYQMSIGATVVLSVAGTTVSWNAVPTATHYELWINYEGGEKAKQARIVYQETYVQTSYTLSAPLPKGRYKAWVRAVRAEEGHLYFGAWSSAADVQVSQAATPVIPDAFLLTELFTAIARDGIAEKPKTNDAMDDHDVAETDPLAPPTPQSIELAETTPALIREFVDAQNI